jgi:hypothetical protein
VRTGLAQNRVPQGGPVIYQLSWKILPGLRGLSCSEFRAVPTVAPDNERGVALEMPNTEEMDAFLRHLEETFAPQRFSNNASAFEAVKNYVLDRTGRRA